ncbi:hypothetical protein STEG23_023493 [Scotinomys teguina]
MTAPPGEARCENTGDEGTHKAKKNGQLNSKNIIIFQNLKFKILDTGGIQVIWYIKYWYRRTLEVQGLNVLWNIVPEDTTPISDDSQLPVTSVPEDTTPISDDSQLPVTSVPEDTTPISDDSQLPITSVPEDTTPSLGFHKHLHTHDEAGDAVYTTKPHTALLPRPDLLFELSHFIIDEVDTSPQDEKMKHIAYSHTDKN